MTLPSDAFSTTVVDLQDSFTSRWHEDPTADLMDDDELQLLIVQQHRFNFDLWHEEDKAREPEAADATIAQVKRNIDGLNQRRNDTITEIDECLQQSLLSSVKSNPDLPWNSETVGSIVDRLSIASLKVFHMQEQADRKDASQQHVQDCKQKLSRLLEQQNDLATALQQLLDELLAGRKQNKLYRQFKMYNDPNLNPKIYQKQAD